MPIKLRSMATEQNVTVMRVSYIIAGIYFLLIVLMYGCEQGEPTSTYVTDELSPSVSFTVSPLSGQPGAIFNVDASASFSRSGTALKFRWDWENDGVWDTAFSTEKFATRGLRSKPVLTVMIPLDIKVSDWK